MILDQELNGERLAGLIRDLYGDRKGREALSEAAQKMGRPEAAKRIVDECYALFQE
jgi:UDP-N-acetylglucosamine:LPS N-acetylglucosamine transferase